jgi:Tfp pilus assembly protein PilF
MIRLLCNERYTAVLQRAAAFGTAALLFASSLAAAPHVPASDDVVLEHLPPAFIAAMKVQRLPAPTANTRPDLDAALATAQHFVEVGQTYSDPRAYGYAQAALGTWWDADPAPAPLLVMRARILQFRHEFPRALAQLKAALKNDEFQPDAWLLFASIEQVQGNIPAARAACLKLIPMADPLVGATCVAATTGLTERAAQAEPLLADALQKSTATSPTEKVWALTTLAEIRTRLGKNADAETAFRQALTIAPDDVYARAAYADLLLDENRNADARAALGDATQADALLLRAAIAAQRAGDSDADVLRKNLSDRFAEARERGDRTHLREQARFALDVEHDVPTALALAQENFAIQREPADARVLLDAAVAATDAKAAQPVIDWLATTRIDAPRLKTLASTLTAKHQ